MFSSPIFIVVVWISITRYFLLLIYIHGNCLRVIVLNVFFGTDCKNLKKKTKLITAIVMVTLENIFIRLQGTLYSTVNAHTTRALATGIAWSSMRLNVIPVPNSSAGSCYRTTVTSQNNRRERDKILKTPRANTRVTRAVEIIFRSPILFRFMYLYYIIFKNNKNKTRFQGSNFCAMKKNIKCVFFMRVENLLRRASHCP